MWQSRVEIEHYSNAYILIALPKFEALLHRTSIKSMAYTHCIDA